MKLTGDQATGVEIVKKALEEPLRQIANNAGVEGSVIVNRVKEEKGNFGFNAATGEFGDMVAFGVIDPAKVTKCALRNAASVASMMLTTEAIVCETPRGQEGRPHGRRAGHGRDGRHVLGPGFPERKGRAPAGALLLVLHGFPGKAARILREK